MSNETKIPEGWHLVFTDGRDFCNCASPIIGAVYVSADDAVAAINADPNRRLGRRTFGMVTAVAAHAAPAATHAAAEEPAKWRPIETAPKDGTVVALARGESVHSGRWGASMYGVPMWMAPGSEFIAAFSNINPPTHWMPLPAAPVPMLTGLTEAETSERASVAGLSNTSELYVQKLHESMAYLWSRIDDHYGPDAIVDEHEYAVGIRDALNKLKPFLAMLPQPEPSASVAPAHTSNAPLGFTPHEASAWSIGYEEGVKAAASVAPATASVAACTCPSGDGSLRWPCPVHPAAAVQAEPAAYLHGFNRDDLAAMADGLDCYEPLVDGMESTTAACAKFIRASLAATQPQATEATTSNAQADGVWMIRSRKFPNRGWSVGKEGWGDEDHECALFVPCSMTAHAQATEREALSEEQIDALLQRLDEEARDCDPHEFGLPRTPQTRAFMRYHVRTWLVEQGIGGKA